MSRNWGIPSKPGNSAMRYAKNTRPLTTLLTSAAFGIFGAVIAGASFSEARLLLAGLFHDKSLYGAVTAAAFGAWFYVWLVRPRFAAHFNEGSTINNTTNTDEVDPFFDILRFYARASAGLVLALFLAKFAHYLTGNLIATLLLCVIGGGGAAAAFQTVISFVPGYDQEPGA